MGREAVPAVDDPAVVVVDDELVEVQAVAPSPTARTIVSAIDRLFQEPERKAPPKFCIRMRTVGVPLSRTGRNGYVTLRQKLGPGSRRPRGSTVGAGTPAGLESSECRCPRRRARTDRGTT